MKKKYSLLLVFLLILSLCACQSLPSSQGSSAAAENTAASASEEFPITLTDQLGRTITLEKEPQRIVSGYYIATSALLALGQKDHLVGIENTPEKRPLYSLYAPELLEFPTVGTVKEFDLEACAALEPDLVILASKQKEAAVSLEELGIPAVVVNPESQELLREMMLLLGTATGSSDRADTWNRYAEDLLSDLNAKLENMDRPTVYLAGNHSYLSTAGPAMFQASQIEQAGGINSAAEISDTYWAEISNEQLLAWDPDVIILASDAAYTAEDLLADPILTDLSAVREDRIYHLPNTYESWDSPVPGSLMGTLWMASVLHPDRISASDYEATVDEYYQNFYQNN